MRGATTLLLALGAGPLVSCSALVEPGVTYRDCAPAHYEEPFDAGSSIETMLEDCWRIDNADNDPDDVFVDDGDLVIRVNEPTLGRREQWRDDDQAPMVYQRIDGDFFVAARVEALHKISGDHCLAPGNQAGWVLRRSAAEWATALLGPFAVDDPAYDCGEDSEAPPPTQLEIRSRAQGWGEDIVVRGDGDVGIGEDGESDLAACRIDDHVTFYYRDQASAPEAPAWVQAGAQTVGAGPLDVGLTAAGLEPSYHAEGHFNWVVIQHGVASDGCLGTLEALVLPEDS